MPTQVITSVENNFTRGLITEATGLNFPENAATSASNCVFTIVGDVTRRDGINFEANGTTVSADRANQSMSTYVWNNPGGDGNSKLLVKQIGTTLYFYNIATSTTATPLSTQLLSSRLTLIPVTTFDFSSECQFSDGNGYLFVYHPSCDTAYVTYNPVNSTLVINPIAMYIRDFTGVSDGLSLSQRPVSLSNDHKYNLANQGWTTSPSWTANSYSVSGAGSLYTFSVASGLSITNGQNVTATGQNFYVFAHMTGTVNSYSGSVLVIAATNITYDNNYDTNINDYHNWNIVPTATGYLNTWNTAEGNYPSNSDIWWLFKNSSGVFDPATTAANISISFGQAPQGHYILPAFSMDRTAISGVPGINPVTTLKRPTTGAWFNGRVFYAGVNDSAPSSADTNFYTWTENVYYSQIITSPTDFGLCYQENDPTSQSLNGLLPTDGGVVPIVGSGTIHRLYPIANGVLVFASNGIWFLTGSTGIGFAANDFTVTKISAVKIISSKSFVDVLGLPFFWNEEGIYQVTQTKAGQFAVEPITVGTILTSYSNIPTSSKKYARGSYDPTSYIIQWCYRSTPETGVTDRYQYDTILTYNTYNKAFYPYNLATGSSNQYIHGVDFISYPYISTNTPPPTFKYHCSQKISAYQHGFAEEYDTTFNDWGNVNYKSTFTTGYKLHGQALKKFQSPYVYIFARTNGAYSAYYIQGAWDYGVTFDSNRWSQPQFAEFTDVNKSMFRKRHVMRGRGNVLQLMVTSVDNQPFDLMGWAMYENVNAGI